MEKTLSSDIKELKNLRIPKAVWEEVEKKIDIEYKALIAIWNYTLHMQLFCSKPIYLNDVKIKLIE